MTQDTVTKEEYDKLKKMYDELQLKYEKLERDRGAGRKVSYSEETERKIQELYSFGSSMDSLAKKFSLSKGTVFKIIHAD
jgi:phage shock protein A